MPGLDLVVHLLSQGLYLVDIVGAKPHKQPHVFFFHAVGVRQFLVDRREARVGRLQLSVERLEPDVELLLLAVGGCQVVSRHGEFLSLPDNIDESDEQHHGKHADDTEGNVLLAVVAIVLGLVFPRYVGEQRGYLRQPLARAEPRGAIAGVADVLVGAVHVVGHHQLVCHLPHGALVQDAVPDVGEHRLRQPIHHARGIVVELVGEIAVERDEGIGVRAFAHVPHPSVVDAQRLTPIAGVEGLQLAVLEHGVVGGRQVGVHPRSVSRLYLLVQGLGGGNVACSMPSRHRRGCRPGNTCPWPGWRRWRCRCR